MLLRLQPSLPQRGLPLLQTRVSSMCHIILILPPYCPTLPFPSTFSTSLSFTSSPSSSWVCSPPPVPLWRRVGRGSLRGARFERVQVSTLLTLCTCRSYRSTIMMMPMLLNWWGCKQIEWRWQRCSPSAQTPLAASTARADPAMSATDSNVGPNKTSMTQVILNY